LDSLFQFSVSFTAAQVYVEVHTTSLVRVEMLQDLCYLCYRTICLYKPGILAVQTRKSGQIGFNELRNKLHILRLRVKSTMSCQVDDLILPI